MNGNNFVSATKLAADVFVGNLETVKIEGSDGTIEEHDNMELVQLAQYGKEYWFILRDLPALELQEIKTQAKIEYIAMMADIDLEEV